jgi:phage-related protein (TIGR01555 family)
VSVLSRARQLLGDLIAGPRAAADGVSATATTSPTTEARASADFGGHFLGAAQLRNRLRGTAASQDPRRQNTWEQREPYDDVRLAAIGRNGVARRCIATRVLDAMRPGWVTDFHTLEKGQAKEVGAAVENYHRRLTTKQAFKRALVWSEQFGHSIIVMGIDDGEPTPAELGKGDLLARPVDRENIRTIHWLKVFNRTRYEIGELSDGVTPEADGTVRAPGLPQYFTLEDLAEPEVAAYEVNTGTPVVRRVRVHWTRVLGPFHTEDGHSRLDEYGEALEDFFTVHDSAERMAATMSIGNLAIDGWNTRTSQDEDNAMAKVRATAEGLSATNTLITDRTEEEFTYVPRPASGLGDIMDRKQILLCASTGYSNMKLFGVDPAGFSSGSEVIDDYNTSVAAVFEDQVEPELRRLTDNVLAAGDGPGVRPVPEEYAIRQNPLRLPSPSEATDIRVKTWEAVHKITGEPLLDRREARESLFGAGASEVTPTIQLAPADTRVETPPQVEVGVAQAILAAAADPTLTPDQKRAVILTVAPQTPADLLARIAPDAPPPDPGVDAGPTDAEALAEEPEQWKTADEIAAAFGSVTAEQIKAHRCPAKGAAVEQPDPRDPGTPGLRWIKPGGRPLYRLSEVRAKFEGGGPDLDSRTPDALGEAPLPPEVPAGPPPGAAGRA